MKTQILQLEPHDDVISTRDKMGWGQAARIVLVWPKKERILVRKLDLLLLNRHAIKMGAQLALVTDDPDVRYNARQLAIPVFKNQRLAHNPRWRAGRRPPRTVERRRPRPDFAALRQEVYPSDTAWYNLSIARRSFHAISIFAGLILLSLVIPAASIHLQPQTLTQKMRIPVTAIPSAGAVNLSGEIPAHQIRFIVEGYEQIASSGSMSVPEKSSFGRVEFTNLTDKLINIPIGLVVTTLPENGQEPIRFSTTVAIDISAGGSALISVRSLVAGKGGNVPAGSIKAVEGPLGLSLSITNPAPTSGGSEQWVSVPTSQDARKLYERLDARLQEDAQKQLNNGHPVWGGFPIESSLTQVSVLEGIYDPPMQDETFKEPAATLKLTLRQEFQGLVVSNQDLQVMATRILDANLLEGYLPLPHTLEVVHLSSPLIDETQAARWRIDAQRKIQLVVNEQQVQELVRGLPIVQAISALQAVLPLDTEPYIQLAPQWWPRLPFLPFRIEVFSP
jgi:hypothetical protein